MRSYRPFLSKKSQCDQNTKYLHRITLLNAMIQITKLLAWVSNIDPSGHFDYPYACIYQLIIEDLPPSSSSLLCSF